MAFSSLQYFRFLANIVSKKVTEVRTDEYRTRYFNCEVGLTFLSVGRHIEYDTISVVIVFLLIECGHGFKKIRDGRVKSDQFEAFESKKHEFFRGCFFGTLTGRIIPK